MARPLRSLLPASLAFWLLLAILAAALSRPARVSSPPQELNPDVLTEIPSDWHPRVPAAKDDIATPLNIRDPAALVMGPAAPERGLERVLPRHRPDDTGNAQPVDAHGPGAPGYPAGENAEIIVPLNAPDPSDLVSAPFEPENPAQRRERLRRERVRAKAIRE